MKTLVITSADIKKSDLYWSDYVGAEDVSDFDGHIKIEANLGYINFSSIKVSGSIVANNGSGIEAGWGIKAGAGIKAGWGIKAGAGIEAGLFITCKLVLKVSCRVFAGLAIWKKEVTNEEKTITCKRLEGGIISYGILKETDNK